MFCPKCGSILKLELKKGRKVMACSCGYAAKPKEPVMIREDVNASGRKVDVVDEEKTVLPKTEADCPKCGHKVAHYWLVQTRAGDEPETKFLRCEKCKYTWRDYS